MASSSRDPLRTAEEGGPHAETASTTASSTRSTSPAALPSSSHPRSPSTEPHHSPAEGPSPPGAPAVDAPPGASRASSPSGNPSAEARRSSPRGPSPSGASAGGDPRPASRPFSPQEITNYLVSLPQRLLDRIRGNGRPSPLDELFSPMGQYLDSYENTVKNSEVLSQEQKQELLQKLSVEKRIWEEFGAALQSLSTNMLAPKAMNHVMKIHKIHDKDKAEEEFRAKLKKLSKDLQGLESENAENADPDKVTEEARAELTKFGDLLNDLGGDDSKDSYKFRKLIVTVLSQFARSMKSVIDGLTTALEAAATLTLAAEIVKTG
ncbi:hypothetical protein F4780DRAFT_609424 [Xylariomycetidae sp. FL0641]|nr:hypothetical protein F4780DRAFT_609424 [Xylariomycetidae sp. FL0641]